MKRIMKELKRKKGKMIWFCLLWCIYHLSNIFHFYFFYFFIFIFLFLFFLFFFPFPFLFLFPHPSHTYFIILKNLLFSLILNLSFKLISFQKKSDLFNIILNWFNVYLFIYLFIYFFFWNDIFSDILILMMLKISCIL